MIVIDRILDCEQYLGDVDGVVFDLDDTLYSEKEYVRSGYAAVARSFPNISDMETRLWHAFELGLPAIDTILEEEHLLGQKAEALAIYRGHTPEIHLYSGVGELLQRLKTTKQMGLITDGRPQGQRAKIEALNLEQYFDCVLITDELGGVEFRKPNPKAFCMMQERFGISFENMIYIGDNLKKDFIAPTQLGMKCCLFENAEGLYFGRMI